MMTASVVPAPILGEAVAMMELVRFLWNATRGSRLRPWQSPYLRWRMETYTGKPAVEVRLADFLRLAWNERRQFSRYLGWVRAMKSYAGTSK